MVFSSLPFLYYFLPAALILYFAVPGFLKNGALLLISLAFYGWGEPKYVLLMVFTILSGYFFGLIIEKYRGRQASRLFLLFSVIVHAGILLYFKYADFFIENFNVVTGLSMPLLRLSLPVGISFYTFQVLSYTIDVYRGDTCAQKNPVALATYVSMFPQLIAGPIVRYSTIAEQLKSRRHTLEKLASGIRRFVLGLGKKILLANTLGELCSLFRESGDRSVLFVWIYAVSFTLQIYFDFSGYSDMAIGLSRIFGFEFPENFNYPYLSASISEFWRRWHISLGTWFRDYIYIPLGGNRVSFAKWLRNLLVVWFLTGFWHGASWNFIVWGLYFAALLMIEKLWNTHRYPKFPKAVCHILVLFFVMIGFVIFDAASLPEAFRLIGAMFGSGSLPIWSAEALYYMKSYLFLFLIAAIGATPLPARLAAKLRSAKPGQWILPFLEPLLLGILLLIMTGYLVDGSFNPFLYFRF